MDLKMRQDRSAGSQNALHLLQTGRDSLDRGQVLQDMAREDGVHAGIVNREPGAGIELPTDIGRGHVPGREPDHPGRNIERMNLLELRREARRHAAGTTTELEDRARSRHSEPSPCRAIVLPLAASSGIEVPGGPRPVASRFAPGPARDTPHRVMRTPANPLLIGRQGRPIRAVLLAHDRSHLAPAAQAVRGPVPTVREVYTAGGRVAGLVEIG